MNPTLRRRRGSVAGATRRLALLALLAAACKHPAPPAPTVALAESARPGVTLERGSESIALTTSRRVEDGAELHTPEAGRATLRLDGGAWALLDSRSRARVSDGKLELLAGRMWVDARAVDAVTVGVPGGSLSATGAGFAVELDDSGARAYCVSGQLTYAAKSSNRLEAGMSVRIGRGGEVKEEPEAQWDDWTGGLAEPGPPRPVEPAGVGQLSARRTDEVGAARVPLLVRRHDVRATIDRDLVVTDVEQVFFNPRSETLEGVYTLRLAPGAILANFEVAAGDALPDRLLFNGRYVPRVVPTAPQGGGTAGVALEWLGGDRYRARIPQLAAGKTEIVRVRYVEWLSRHDQRRTWVYAMGGGNPPLLGEFSLELDATRAGAQALEAGMGARVENNKVVLRRSDFRPRADFAVDLLDEKPATLPAYTVATSDDVGKGYVLVGVDPPFAPPPASLDLVLLVDVSAATDPTRLDLEKAVVDAILRQLTTRDRVAVLAASVDARPLGAAPPLAPLSSKRAEELLDALARQPPAGATDLGVALTTAAQLAGPEGVVVYIGDGRPTVGPLLPRELSDRLARLGDDLPRIFSVGVGADARGEILSAIASGALTTRVEDRPDAAHAAYRVLAAAALPTLRNVTVDLGSSVDVLYPAGPLTISAGEPLRLYGRLRGAAPVKLTLSGRRAGKPFTEEVKLAPVTIEEGGDLRRRWAAGRLGDLLSRGAGREAVTQIGTRFGLVTPWSALVTTDFGGTTYQPLQSFGDETGVPAALSDGPPDDTPIVLEEDTTSRPSGSSDLGALYQQVLGEHDEAVRACYDKKAANHPELSGRVELKIKIGLGGEIPDAKLLSSSLRDGEVEACMLRAVRAMRLPPPPDAKVRELVRAWQFEAEDGRLGASARCSAASHQYLSTRRGLWRERLGSNPGVEGAMAVWRQAERACELKTWLDRRALLDLLRPHVGRTLYQIDLFHRFPRAPDVQAYLKREILRAVRSADDVRAIRGGLSLDGGVSAELLEQQLKRAPDAVARIKVLRQFLALSPDGIALRVRLLELLEEAGQKEEASRVAYSLGGDPAADVTTRQRVGEFFARRGDASEAARAWSEIVEFAPFDPWARRRLGDLYGAHDRFEDAYREYSTLAWLLPNDSSVLLLLARAAAGAGRIDEALRLEDRLAETVEAGAGGHEVAAWAQAWHELRLAALRDGARRASDVALTARLAARSRESGVLSTGGAGRVLVGLTWAHPDARLQLELTAPGDQLARRAPVLGGAVGIEAVRLARLVPGAYRLAVRRPGAAETVRAFDATLWVLWDEGEASEKLTRIPVHLASGMHGVELTLNARELGPPRPITVVAR